MLTRSRAGSRSTKIAGILWIVAGVLCLAPRLLTKDNGMSPGIGIMFITFGIVALSRSRNRKD